MTPLSQDEVKRFHDGDEAVFRQVVDSYSPRLLAVARPFARDLDEAYDLVQETWQRVYQKRHTYTATGSFLGWLYAVCRTVCLTAAGKRSSRNNARVDMPTATPTPSVDPHTAAENADFRDALNRALLELPERQRQVVILRFLEQLSTRETAKALGCAEGTVKATLSHAVRKLRKVMEVWVR